MKGEPGGNFWSYITEPDQPTIVPTPQPTDEPYWVWQQYTLEGPYKYGDEQK